MSTGNYILIYPQATQKSTSGDFPDTHTHTHHTPSGVTCGATDSVSPGPSVLLHCQANARWKTVYLCICERYCDPMHMFTLSSSTARQMQRWNLKHVASFDANMMHHHETWWQCKILQGDKKTKQWPRNIKKGNNQVWRCTGFRPRFSSTHQY